MVDDGAEGEVERLLVGVAGRRTAAEAPVVTCTTGGVVTMGVAVVVFVGGDDGDGVVGATVSVVPGVFTVVVVTGKLTVTVVDGMGTVIVVTLGRPIAP